MTEKSLLVTGSTGYVGYHVARALGPQAMRNRLDLADPETLAAKLELLAPKGVFHAGAVSKPHDVAANPADSRVINVDSTVAIARWCTRENVPLVFCSSGGIFDGQHAPYDEDANPSPITTYGRQKLDAESAVRVVNRQACVIRLPWMFGPRSPTKPGFLYEKLDAARITGKCAAFDNVFGRPLAIRALVELLPTLFKAGQGKLLHLGGAERVSLYGFCEQALKQFDIDVPLTAKQHDGDGPPALDTCLNNDRASALGLDPWSLDAEFEHLLSTT